MCLRVFLSLPLILGLHEFPSWYMSYGSSSLGNPTLGAAQGYLVLGLLIAVRA